jgi:steroid 5-alpha reductase family enzyme
MKRLLGLLSLFVLYALATVAAVVLFTVFEKAGMNEYLNILVVDVIATVIVWFGGVLLRTASAYDPYWSIQTLIIYTFIVSKHNNWNFATISLFVVIFVYSLRLTMNFIVGFHSLSYVDWRYKMLKEKSGKAYQLVNLFGICMFPTLVVYSASLPAIAYANLTEYSFLDAIGLSVILFGTLLEFVSDLQMKKFVKVRNDRSEVLNKGLWKYSRHPNYLGEILIWFGVALTLIVSHLNYWYLAAGSIVNLLMFLFISIPMEEKHFKAYKPDYEQYKKETSVLLILPKKK